jgi:hypothetical protein
MKFELHVPVEQYGFVSADIETTDYAQVRETYDAIKDSFAAKLEGLDDKSMTDFIQNQLKGTPNETETWEKMNPAQKTFVKLLKNALNRKN